MSAPMTDVRAMEIVNGQVPLLSISQDQVDEAWQVAIDRGYVQWAVDCRYTPEAERMVLADRCQKKTDTWVLVEGRDLTDGISIKEVYSFDNLTDANRHAFEYEGRGHIAVECTVTQDEDDVDTFKGVKSVADDTVTNYRCKFLVFNIETADVADHSELTNEEFEQVAKEHGAVYYGAESFASAFNAELMSTTTDVMRIVDYGCTCDSPNQ